MIRSALQLVIHLENTLGWVPNTGGQPLSTARALAVKRITEKIAENPELYTWRNLELTVEYLRRHRTPIRRPLALFLYVEEALQYAAEPAKARPLGELIDAAIANEQEAQRDDAVLWIGRLTRARGDARAEVYAQWQAARGLT